MRSWAIEFLRCRCGAQLKDAFESAPGGETASGVLQCRGERFGAWYPVVRGIPHMLSPELRQDLTRIFVQEFRSELEAQGVGLGRDMVRRNTEKVVPLKRWVLRPLCGLADVGTVQVKVPG